jgi:hypothetical protein
MSWRLKELKNTKETLKLAYEQMLEDREVIKASYQKFADQMDTLNDYAVNGANINKCLELLTKQTAQLLELAKLQNTIKRSADDHFSGRDAEGLYSMIKSGDVTELIPKKHG